MLYKKLFELSGLTNHQIVKKLEITHTSRIQFEKSKYINIEKFIYFIKKLELDKEKLLQMIVLELKLNLKK